jgi:hypothetical protein
MDIVYVHKEKVNTADQQYEKVHVVP